jgi:thermostable 8-oxoguanine DNA glycosylase
MVTINEITPTVDDIQNSAYSYQNELTAKLDRLDTDFDQETINEIVLWKVNRYAAIDIDTLRLINQIKRNDTQLNPELTGAILLRLLGKEQKGVRLAMASTILRFKNPTLYQIIDQRVFRFLYGKELKYSETDINEQINLYLDYLQKLKNICNEHNVDFKIADRIFYAMDKAHNPSEKLNGY